MSLRPEAAPAPLPPQVVVEAVLQEEPLGEDTKAPLLVELQVAVQQHQQQQQSAAKPSPALGGKAATGSGRGSSAAAAAAGADQLAAALGKAEAAAATHLQQAPQATGERLHHNFLQILGTVQQHDSHLLVELELEFIAAYKVRCRLTAAAADVPPFWPFVRGKCRLQ